MWQALFDDVSSKGFVVLAVALDQAEAARAWIDAAKPAYPCLIDRDHRVAELYNLVNVPQAVWIDEAGVIVRGPETAGSTDGFRAMDRKTFTVPPEVLEERARVKDQHLGAIRDWALAGSASRFVQTPDQVRANLPVPDEKIAQAHVYFRLGQVLLRQGRQPDAAAAFKRAVDLHPDSWAIWRQTAVKDNRGLAAGPEFWARVDALGDKPYYRPLDLGVV